MATKRASVLASRALTIKGSGDSTQRMMPADKKRVKVGSKVAFFSFTSPVTP